jgi:hypothetical protein
MDFENGVLHVENAQGKRWQLTNTEKPRLNFDYDALFVSQERALRRVGTNLHPLTENELREVATFIGKQKPPAKVQLAADLKMLSHGLINSVVTQLEYDNLLDVQITGRADSTDLYAEEARRVLAYADSVWNAFHGLAAQIKDTPEAGIKTLKEYANMMPMAPAIEHFLDGKHAAFKGKSSPPKKTPSAKASQPAAVDGRSPSSPVTVETPAAETADFANIVDRVLVFDEFFSNTQLHVLEQWALQTPHWMLTNSTHDEEGKALHRIWGASYIGAWQRSGWTGLPPVLFSALATIYRKLNVTITTPEYIGLNGQSRGQDASMHSDCALDSSDDLSILVYLGEDTTGDLILYDKKDQTRELQRIAFRPNRIVAFDGSIPHQALAPDDDKFRISVIIRGKYRCGSSDLVAGQDRGAEK